MIIICTVKLFYTKMKEVMTIIFILNHNFGYKYIIRKSTSYILNVYNESIN